MVKSLSSIFILSLDILFSLVHATLKSSYIYLSIHKE